MENNISKSQTRAMILAGLPVAKTYSAASEALEAISLRGDGVPQGKTWRDATKIADSELLAAIGFNKEERGLRSCYNNAGEIDH